MFKRLKSMNKVSRVCLLVSAPKDRCQTFNVLQASGSAAGHKGSNNYLICIVAVGQEYISSRPGNSKSDRHAGGIYLENQFSCWANYCPASCDLK